MRLFSCLAAAFVAVSAAAQTPTVPPAAPATAPAPPAAEAKTAPTGPLAPLAWLEGCWRGTAGTREFREQWMPLRGAMMLGVSQTVDKGETQGYEYLRLEQRSGSVFYVASPPGKAEIAFRFEGETTDKTSNRNDTIFTFVNPADEFPKQIAYRRASGGWLYASVEGKVGGADRQATYPMRRINCESGEFIAN
jgi:hypothetical protein